MRFKPKHLLLAASGAISAVLSTFYLIFRFHNFIELLIFKIISLLKISFKTSYHNILDKVTFKNSQTKRDTKNDPVLLLNR